MNRITLFFAFFTLMSASSCIKDDIIQDFVQPEIRITNEIDTLGVDSVFTYEFRYLNNVGLNQEISAEWSSSDESVVTINSEGQARGVAEGDATITASYFDPSIEDEVSDSRDISIGEAILPPPMMDPLRVIDGVIATTTFYPLSGSFQFSELEDGGVTIDIASDYIADDRLPGLYIYLSNNRNSINGALEIDEVTIFAGAHSYTVPNIEFDEYRFIVYFCKPFNVKVGEATLDF